jgi:hypothetical protein
MFSKKIKENADVVAKTFSDVYHAHDDGLNPVTEQTVVSSGRIHSAC